VEKLFRDLEDPSGIKDFNAFLRQHRGNLEESFRAIVPSNMSAKVGLDDKGWMARITGEDTRCASAEAEASSDYRTVKNVELTAAGKEDYDTAKWAKARRKTIAEEDVLSFLSRKAVIPKYGFPVDVVELDTQRTQYSQQSTEISLQRDLTIAVSEFAPTSKLVANKLVWTSYGLKKVAEKEWDRRLYKRCPRHNVFLQWKQGQSEPTTSCGDQLAVCEYVIPRFGFVTARDKPKQPTSRTPRVFTTRPYFSHALGADPLTVTIPANSPLMTMKKASPGVMVVLCEGRRGEGFYICGSCGAGFRRRENAHKNPYGESCNGSLKALSLGHEFVTDVLQLQFHLELTEQVEPVWFAYSIAYALVEAAAEILEVPSTDLNATVAHSHEFPVPPMILYDNVPGGAGLVARLEEEAVLRTCLEAARKRVSGDCGCEENTSCYGCLRSYRNQFAHQHLRRGSTMRYLQATLSGWA
jgi:hypothetical protein